MKSKRDKRMDAEARNAEWAGLTPYQQTRSLNERGVRATKQRAEIAARVEALEKEKK